MASVEAYSTKSGKRYRVRYRGPDHSQTDKRGFLTKKAAEAFLHDVEGSKNRGQFIEARAASARVEELGTAWLDGKKTRLKPSSYRPLEIGWRMRVKPKWGSRAVSSIGYSDVQAWVTALAAEKSASVVLRDYGILAGILDNAVRDRRIAANPARGVELPRKVKRQHPYLTHDQLLTLATNSGDHKLLILTLGYTGLRWGEMAALRAKGVDVVTRRVTVAQNAVEVGSVIEVGTPKSHELRTLRFPEFFADVMAERIALLEPEDLVFGREDGSHIRRAKNSASGYGWFAQALTKSGLPVMRIHDLRHTTASLAVSAGANVKALQRMMGHASAAMTLDVYADLFDDDLNAVSVALNDHAMKSVVGKTWAEALFPNEETPYDPRK